MNLLFVSGTLERGGLEVELGATARLALDAGHRVTVATPYKVRNDAPIRAALGDAVGFVSGQEAWRDTLQGRALLTLASTKHLLQQRHQASAADEVHLARRFVPAASDLTFWDAHARRVLTGCELVHLFGKPKPFLVRAARQARSLGLRTIFEEASEVTAEYVRRRDHLEFAGAPGICDLVIARCAAHVERIREHYGYRGPTQIIEQWAYGVEEELLAVDRRAGTRARAPVTFGSLGRLDAGKGIDTMLQAFARARQVVPGIRLQMAGTGQAEGDFRALVERLTLSDEVDFVGYKHGAGKVDFYAGLDAFVIASLNEGGPITGVEAMAAALPIISTPVGAMPERLRPAADGLFFRPGDVEALTAHMIEIAATPARRTALGAAARSRYLARNHSSVCAREKLSLWEQMGAAACPA